VTAQFHRDMAAAYAKSTTTVNPALSKAEAAEAARLDAVVPPVTAPPVVTPPATTNLERVIYCTKAPHELDPHGVPTSYDWQHNPTGLGGQNWNAGKGLDSSAPDGCLIFWGQVYLGAGQTLPTNARVAVRNCRALATDGKTWFVVQDQKGQGIGGGGYPESFVGSNTNPNVRTEPDGSISSKPIAGFNYHFWIGQWPRPAIPHGATGFVSTVEARLVADNPANPPEPGRLVVNCGIDLYNRPDQQPDTIQGGLGQGRFCIATTAWQTMGFSTWTEAQLRALPPPV
jgi:hypothetical protein